MAVKTRRAEIIGLDRAGGKVVVDETGEYLSYPRGAIAFPSAPVGSQGYIEYRTGPSYGLWFFVPDEVPESQGEPSESV